MSETNKKTKDYEKMIEQVDREINMIMAELHIIEQKKNNILQKIDSLVTEKKMENVRKKFLNNKI